MHKRKGLRGRASLLERPRPFASGSPDKVCVRAADKGAAAFVWASPGVDAAQVAHRPRATHLLHAGNKRYQNRARTTVGAVLALAVTEYLFFTPIGNLDGDAAVPTAMRVVRSRAAPAIWLCALSTCPRPSWESTDADAKGPVGVLGACVPSAVLRSPRVARFALKNSGSPLLFPLYRPFPQTRVRICSLRDPWRSRALGGGVRTPWRDQPRLCGCLGRRSTVG